ncbi:MAG TPA: putative quinol monooxygenase [Gemmatimonadaceae bacterium]|nr:putative quinol monooxygenase [Gemmatimonadaceae bacterium]
MPSDSATIVIAYRALPGQADRAREELATLIDVVVREEPDCQGIHLHQDAADPHRLLLIEYWASADAFTGPHMQTPHLRAFMERSRAFIAGPPEITFWREMSAALPAGR